MELELLLMFAYKKPTCGLIFAFGFNIYYVFLYFLLKLVYFLKVEFS